MTKDEALKLALDALETSMYPQQKQLQAITAIKEALANEALEKMAENARELGLDYETEQEPMAWATREDFYFELNRRVDRMREEMMIKTITMRCKEYDLALPIVDMYGGHIVVGQVSFPPQRKPLRDHEIAKILDRERMKWHKSPPTYEFDLAFARAIEAAHGIKGEA